MKNRFKVIDVNPRGFCKGVYNAIELAKKARLEHPNEKISILGELVHNKDVTSALSLLNIDTIESKGKTRLELLDQAHDGIIIFSAHGVSPLIENKAKSKGLQTINASCVDVLVTQDLIKKYIEQNYEILYIGQRGHPEAEAVLEINESKINLVEIGLPIPKVDSPLIFVTNQTTMSIFDIQETLNLISLKYPHAVLSNETCSATRLRQEAILKLPNSVDAIVIIGDRQSNNTRMLAKIAQNKEIRNIISVQNLRELDPSLLDHCVEVAITAGASTPKFIIDSVVNFIKAYAQDDSVRKEDYLIKPFV